MHRYSIHILVASVVTLITQTAVATPVFYSISVRPAGDELVKVDAATGQVTTIGSIGNSVPMEFPSIAVADGRLFLVHLITGETPTSLMELNRSTGGILAENSVTLAGDSVPLVEGFDSFNGQLRLSYGLTWAGGTRSNRIGDLALDGTVSNSIILSSSDDLDGMAIDSQGRYFGADANSPHGASDILSVSLSPPSTTLLSTIGSANTKIVDLAFTDTDLLFGLDLNKQIHQIDPVTGSSLSAVSFDPSLTLRGLAFVAPVPEPSTYALAAIGLFGLGICGWRRCRSGNTLGK